jgi:ABC-type oligopeptide transport system ATPase subunit
VRSASLKGKPAKAWMPIGNLNTIANFKDVAVASPQIYLQSLFGARIDPLKDVDLEVNNGEFLMIVGRSGSGKTTLLNLCEGLIKRTSGQIFIDNFDIAQMSDEKKQKDRLYFSISESFFELNRTGKCGNAGFKQ